MKKLILIRGPICAGKSTTANLLQKNIKECSLIDQDSLKRSIDKRKPSQWRDKIAFDTTLYLANSLMKRGRDIIADIHSSIPRQYLEYKKLAERNKYRLFSFLLYPPLAVCLARNKGRDIPDVQYKITNRDIKKYWRNPYTVAREIVIDTSLVTTKDVIKRIVRAIK